MPASWSLDAIHASYGFGPWRAQVRGPAVSEGTLAGRKTYLLKPQTYMNDSGVSVGAALRFFKLPLSALVVIHDEIDLAAGKLKVKTGGGDAGQNGLRSITAALGPGLSPGAHRHRPSRREDRGHGHVLQNFSKDDMDWLRAAGGRDGRGRAAAGQGRRCRLHEQGGAAAPSRQSRKSQRQEERQE